MILLAMERDLSPQPGCVVVVWMLGNFRFPIPPTETFPRSDNNIWTCQILSEHRLAWAKAKPLPSPHFLSGNAWDQTQPFCLPRCALMLSCSLSLTALEADCLQRGPILIISERHLILLDIDSNPFIMRWCIGEHKCFQGAEWGSEAPCRKGSGACWLPVRRSEHTVTGSRV